MNRLIERSDGHLRIARISPFYIAHAHDKICFSLITDDQTIKTLVLGQKTVIFKSLVTITNDLYIDRSAQNIEQMLPTFTSISKYNTL